MNTFIRNLLVIVAALVAGVLSEQAYAAEGETVVNPLTRQRVLEQAKNLLAAKPQAPTGKDPFHSEAYAESIAGATRGPETPQVPSGDNRAAPGGPRNTRDLLQAIATSPSLKPSGYFVLGGQPTLVFGQKRVKAGSFLTITFEGAEYALEIVSIDRPNFTLRLNREEFTRTIK